MISIRNKIDFYLRSHVKWGREVPIEKPVSVTEALFQKELKEFFSLLQLKDQIKKFKGYRIVDVGAKNFILAPVFDEIFEQTSCDVEIHGIEVDAYRRLRDGYTRADYGRYFARKARKAVYHPKDFLEFTLHCDFAFLLNPFVSKEPLLAWGLPLNFLQPEKLFKHACDLLRPMRGTLVLSHPSKEEFETGCRLAKQAGFFMGPPVVWEPSNHSIQKKPRWGSLAFTR